MADYMLYGEKMIEDDSCMKNFAKSLLKDLDKACEIYRSDCDSDKEFEERIINAVWDCINYDLPRTDINYRALMEKFAGDIGHLLFDMDNEGFDLSEVQLSFFEGARDSFQILLYRYIQIHFDELKKDCLCRE